MDIIVFIASWLVSAFGCGLLGGYINEKKGCKYWTGFWCSFFFGLLGLIIVAVQKNQNENIKNVSKKSNAEELKTYKELLDSGAITQEEFDIKKKELLNL